MKHIRNITNKIEVAKGYVPNTTSSELDVILEKLNIASPRIQAVEHMVSECIDRA